MCEELIQKVQSTVSYYNMLEGTKKLVIAFSTGPDSVCLLDTLHTLYRTEMEFHLVYVNHGLRSRKFLKHEEKLVKMYASKYGTAHKIVKIKVAKKKAGIEASAREKRYRALLNYMKKINARRIAFGHNLDDLIETFFMNMLRGSGSRGLRSILPVRLPIVRPLVDIKKKSILDYLRAKRLAYSLDETNRVLSFRRNFLRHKIIPELVKLNPELHETIKREIALLRQDDEFLEKLAQQAYERVAREEQNHIELDIKRILKYNPSVANRVVMKIIKMLRGNLDGFESKHFEAIVGLTSKESNKRINLPKRIYARREYDKIVFGIQKPEQRFEKIVKAKDDRITCGDVEIRIHTVSDYDLAKRKKNCEVFDLDHIDPPFVIRNRKRGDYIDTKIGKKKMKKIYNEHKIPVHERGRLLMLCDRKGILWILGLARAYRGFVGKKSKKILVVEFENVN